MTEIIKDQTVEQVETAAVEPAAEKVYTEAEFNARLDEVLGKKIARKEAKIRKEYDKKYGRLTEVLQAGTGSEDVEQLTNTFEDFYAKKGIKLPPKQTYSARDIEVLAKAEADDIIRSGYDEVVEEVDRLAAVGVAKMTPREKAVFTALAEHRQAAERGRELSKMGVTEDVYNSPEFTAFAGKFNATTPIADVYEIYKQTQPKKNITPMGSMKNTAAADNGVKDFYSRDEALKFTKKDFDNNPALYKAVQASMLKW